MKTLYLSLTALILSFVTLSIPEAPAHARAKARPPQTISETPPAGGEALFAWCRSRVYRKYGSSVANGLTLNVPKVPGRKYLYMDFDQEYSLTQGCVQRGGQNI
jgi:hypothetical protein